jgi:GcrA cell cycle regulator
MSANYETWTSERVELLKHYFNAGLSCSQIAGEIGATRNAVIGKLHRLGLGRPRDTLAGRFKQTRVAKNPARPKALRPKSWRLSIRTQHAMLRAAYPTPAGNEASVDSPHKCSLLELSQAQCRWPISEPGAADFRFCGNSAVEGVSYCAGHARIAYRLRSRQRDREPTHAVRGG